MNAFDYAAPQSVDEAVSLLAEGGDDTGILAGGTDIIAQLREGRRRVNLLMDVKKIPETNELSYDPQGGLQIGSSVPCCLIYENEIISAAYPALVDSTSLIGSVQIQGRATVGGNLCNSSPAADTIPTIIVLGAVCQIAGPDGRREVPVEEFCTGPGQNVLGNGEFLISLHIPVPKKNSGAFFLRFIPRNEMDIAVVNAAASVVLNDEGTSISEAKIAVGAVAPIPLRVLEAEEALVGQEISDDIIQKASDIAQASANPISDMRGTIRQRKHLTGVLTRRAIKGAIQRSKES